MNIVAMMTHLPVAVSDPVMPSDSPTVPSALTVSNASRLIALYNFEEGSGTTTADLSGNGFNGTFTNGPVWVAGKYGNGLSFNASDDGNDSNDPKVVLGRTINIPNAPFTFSAWVNPASFADWRAIISKRDSPSSSRMRVDIGLSASSGRVYVAGANFRAFLYSPPLNAWTHLAVVVEAGGTKLYVNGVLRETIGAITLGTGTTANMAIGGTGEGTGGDNDPYKGLLDDLRLYDRAQTQAEIALDMNTPGAAPPPAASTPLPLVAAASAVQTSPAAPAVLRVFPNPFRGSTRIEARGGDEVAVYDVTGRRVRNWRSASAPSALGVLAVEWDGTDRAGRRLPAGIYFVKAGRNIARVALLR